MFKQQLEPGKLWREQPKLFLYTGAVPLAVNWTIFKQKGTNIDLESLEKLLKNHLGGPNFRPVGFSLITEKLNKLSTYALGSWNIYILSTFTQDDRTIGAKILPKK